MTTSPTDFGHEANVSNLLQAVVEEILALPQEVVDQAITLVREVQTHATADAPELLVPTGASAERARQIAAKVMSLLATTPYPPQDVAVKLLFLIQDLAVLPAGIAAEAVVLGGEIALPARAALAAFDWLTTHDYAVFGVELWQQAGNMPQWIATSNYETKQCHALSKWTEYVACCAKGARQFVERFSAFDAALFNYSWGRQG